MLLSPWIVADMHEYKLVAEKAPGCGFCVDFYYPGLEARTLVNFGQSLPDNARYSLFISPDSFEVNSFDADKALNLLMMCFFQPSFYTESNAPVIFAGDTLPPQSEQFLHTVAQHCRMQGFRDLIVVTPVGNGKPRRDKLQWWPYNEDGNQPGPAVRHWLESFATNGVAQPIYFMINGYDTETRIACSQAFRASVDALYPSADYRIAEKCYLLETEKQAMTETIQQQRTNEKNLQLYLEIQKKDLAKALDWYHYEYEILPLWFKRIGQVLKVMMGRRSFRSLFDDNVKKYKD